VPKLLTEDHTLESRRIETEGLKALSFGGNTNMFSKVLKERRRSTSTE